MKKETEVTEEKPKENTKELFSMEREEVSRELLLEVQLNNAKADIVTLKKLNLEQAKQINILTQELLELEEKECLTKVENLKKLHKMSDKTTFQQDPASGKWHKVENK